VPALGTVFHALGHAALGSVGFTLSLPLVAGTVGTMSPPLVAGFLTVVAVLAVVGLRLFADRGVRLGEAWGCGRSSQTSRMEYTATSFAQPLRRVFAELYRPTEDLSVDFHPESRYFVHSIEYRSRVHPWFERALYDPARGVVRRMAAGVRRLQAGSLHLYLLYLTVTLLLLLLASRWHS
jgi:hydrogenase-4 component B